LRYIVLAFSSQHRLACERLPPPWIPTLLHDITIDDVAEILGVPQNTVKTLMVYARKRLAELLAAKGIQTCRLGLAPRLHSSERHPIG
jgi:hypothetical protein